MNVDRVIIELQKLMHVHGTLNVRVESPKGAISLTAPAGTIWNVKLAEHAWGKEIIIEAA